MKRAAILAAALALAAFPAAAGGFGAIGTLAQHDFRALSEDLGAAFSYKGVTPATALGPLGFDVGVEVTDTRLEHSGAFSRAGNGVGSDIVLPKLHVYKGLPGGFDVGAFIARSSDVDASVYGAELRYALLEDRLAMPAVGVRLSGTKATGLGDLDVSTVALDAMVSKRFTLLTPYAGAGVVRVATSVGGSALADETFNRSRVFGGLNLNLLAVNLAFEAEKMGGATSLSAKLGWRF